MHWAHGGTTSPENLVRLCSHHHRLVHERGYTIAADPAGELVFRRPDGRLLPARAARCGGHAAALTQLSRRHGVHPGPTTITPDWNADSLDIDWAVTVLVNTA